MFIQIWIIFAVLATYFCRSLSLQASCNTTFSDLKHSITKVICPANCLTHSHELCGNGLYSRGPICLAAIQDQQIDNSGGLVTVYTTDGEVTYMGDQRNGVSSQSCGPSNTSYTFTMTCSTNGNSETEVTQVVCPANCSKSRVYICGTGSYLQNSSVCGAAYSSSTANGKNVVTFYKKVSEAQSAAPSKCQSTSGSFTFNRSINECDLGHRCENNSTCVDGIIEYFCACANGYYGKFCQEKLHCWSDDQLRKYIASDGVATFCDNGWTIRNDPKVNFNRSWSEYATGFGTTNSSFWWGLENVHVNTIEGNCSLRIDLWDFNGNHKYAIYGTFSVDSKEEKFRLNVADYQNNSTAVDALADKGFHIDGHRLNYNNGMNFSTYDRDNDISISGNCAAARAGGWWFNNCGRSGLNGPIVENPTGFAYVRWQGRSNGKFPWRKTTMKFRCI